MLSTPDLATHLRAALEDLQRKPLAELLLEQGLLRRLASDHLLASLRASVVIEAHEQAALLQTLWHGLPGSPPEHCDGDWISQQPEPLRPQLQQRWDQLRLQKWMELQYGERLEPYFLERRADLERVVYGLIRLQHQGIADELYLRLIDDGADFGQLAREHSVGDERFTYGLVGPMPISQPHPVLRRILDSLTVGEIHPPVLLDQWVVLVRMEHREPARLDDSTRLRLLQELLQQDLDARLDEELANLYPALLAMTAAPFPSLTPADASA